MLSKFILYFILIPALLPVVLILIFVYRKDKKEREPVFLILKTLIFGAIFSLPCIPVEMFFGGIIQAAFDTNTIQYALVQNIAGIALVEEFFKFLVLMLYIWKNKNFDYRYDGIVYAVTAAMGFAALENIIYITRFGTGVSVGRALFAIPGHATFGVFMGFFLSRAKDLDLRGDKISSGISLVFSLAIPILVHGIYDFLLSAQAAAANLNYFFLIWVIILDVAAWFTIKHDFETDRPLGCCHIADKDGNIIE